MISVRSLIASKQRTERSGFISGGEVWDRDTHALQLFLDRGSDELGAISIKLTHG